MNSLNVLSEKAADQLRIKDQLKNADDTKVLEVIEHVSEKVKLDRIEKWKHDVVAVLSQKKPSVNSRTRVTYQNLIYDVCAVTERINPFLFQKARVFAKNNGLKWRRD